MNADGSEQTRLTNSTLGEGIPSWSPDGKKLAFISDIPSSPDIYVLDLDRRDK
jgi:Tol biopolymer transport system component